MKIGMLVSHPTQFDAPFFRYASEDRAHSFRVIYWDERQTQSTVDPELDREIQWGIDLFGGYSSVVMPVTRLASRLWHEIRDQQFDLLVVNGYNHWVLLAAVGLARLTGSAVALRLDSVTADAFSGLKGRVKRRVLPVLFGRYHAFLAVSSLTRQYLIDQRVSPDSIRYFTYCVDHAWFRARSALTNDQRVAIKRHFGLAPEKKLILAIAKLTPRETPWDLLRVASSLDRGDVELLLAGDGLERPQVTELTRHARMHVALPGYVQYTDLPSLYAVADVFVHAPRREPYGVSVAEALACGVPVIAASTVGAAYDFIVEGQNGFVYELGDSEQLKDRLVTALDALDGDRLRRVSAPVLEQWNHQATWKSILECARQVRAPDREEVRA